MKKTWFENYLLKKDENGNRGNSLIFSIALFVVSSFVYSFVEDNPSKIGTECCKLPLVVAVGWQLLVSSFAMYIVDAAKRRSLDIRKREIEEKESYELREELKRCKLVKNGMDAEAPAVLALIAVLSYCWPLLWKTSVLDIDKLSNIWAWILAVTYYYVIVASNVGFYGEMIIEIESILSKRAEQADSGTVLVVVSRSKEDKEVKQDVFTDEHKYLVKWQRY